MREGGHWRTPPGCWPLLVSLALLVMRRHILLDRLATMAFRVIPGRSSRRIRDSGFKADRTSGAMGGSPASGRTHAQPLVFPGCAYAPAEPRIALEGLVRLADWAIHAPDQTSLPAPASRDDIHKLAGTRCGCGHCARFRHASPARS